MDLKRANLDSAHDSDSEASLHVVHHVPIMEFKAEVEEEQEVSINKQEAVETGSKYQLRNQYVSKQHGRHLRK